MRRLLLRAGVLAALLLGLSLPARAEDVIVQGQVLQPGAQALSPNLRLFDAVRVAGVRRDAYLAGAAWLSTAAVPAQRDLKVGLLHDLTQLLGSARLAGDTAREMLARALRERIEALPVSGRVAVALDPIALELQAKHNRPLQAGDVVLYPARPSTVRVVGAVAAECVLPFVALQPAPAYAAACPPHAAADPDWLYVIQPDGEVQRLGIGPWNGEPAPVVAPGALILRPLEPDALSGIDFLQLNDELARFYATQPLPLEARP